MIVESPTKAKTIGAFLGKGFTVKSSFGHVRDLPKGKMGVDTEHDFAPSYIIPTKARKTVTELKKLAEKSDAIYFATDEDREGEAISWHLAEVLAMIRQSSSASLSTKSPRKRSCARSKIRANSTCAR